MDPQVRLQLESVYEALENGAEYTVPWNLTCANMI